MESVWIILISFLSTFILIFSFCLIIINKRKKNKIKDVDFSKLNQFWKNRKHVTPMQLMKEFSEIEIIKNNLINLNLHNSNPDAHRSPRSNQSVIINMILFNQAFNKKTKHNTVNINKEENCNNNETNIINM